MERKTYILLKDLPGVPAGNVITWNSKIGAYGIESMEGDGYVFSEMELKRRTGWFQEKLPPRFLPELHQVYSFINDFGAVSHALWADNRIDRARWLIGNCFGSSNEDVTKLVETQRRVLAAFGYKESDAYASSGN